MTTQQLTLIPIVHREMFWITDGVICPFVWLDATVMPALEDLARVVTLEGDRGFAEGLITWRRESDETVVSEISITSPVTLQFGLMWSPADVELLRRLQPDRIGFTTQPYGVTLLRSAWVTMDINEEALAGALEWR